MIILKVILYYLSLGFLWTGMMSWINQSTESNLQLGIPFIIINTLIWPFSLVLFVVNFAIGFFDNEDF